ncbi:MAG: helix-turn-helix transcriptional regulator [Peptococcales bacterium]|jgi:predicted transcriptional regulator YheO
MVEKLHPILAALIPVADGLRANFGDHCEVVIHDLEKPEKSLVHIAGNLTGRKLGAPITNLVLEALKQKGDSVNNLIGYETTTKDNKILKSSTIFIRDERGKIIGCFCINLDMTNIFTCIKILESFSHINQMDNQTKEEFSYDVNEVMEAMVEAVFKEHPKPKTLMDKDDKVYIVKKLENKGVFLIKGAIEYVANSLGVSRYTIYNYLDEIRANSTLNKIS